MRGVKKKMVIRLGSRTSRNKAGFEKIEFCRELDLSVQ